jgi:hypothetical protein
MRVSNPFVFSGAILTVVLAHSTLISEPPTGKSVEITKSIPLESCCATFGGSGCKLLPRGLGEPHENFLNQLVQFGRSGSSNVALVRGKDITRAVRAGSIALCGGFLLDTPVLPDQEPDSKAEALWLIANLGTSAAGRRRVHAVELTGRTIRLSFSRPNPGMVGN